MRHTSARHFIFIAILITAVMYLCGCSCDHIWQEATCLAPQTCIRCGKTQGEPIPHVFGDTICISPEPCIMCGTLDGIELTHKWREDGKLCLLCGLDKRTTDERFMDELALGLSESWQYIHPNEEALALTGQMEPRPKEDWVKAFALGYDRISPLKDAAFRDEMLGQWANIYIETMESAIAALDLFNTEEWDAQYTNWIYHDRTMALYKINEIYPIPVHESDKEALSIMLDDGRIINAVNLLCKDVNFHNIDNSDGKHEHEAFVVNNTGMDFKSFELTVNLLDENEVLMETKVFSLKNWRNGEKETLTFVTDKNFRTIEIPYAVWILDKIYPQTAAN